MSDWTLALLYLGELSALLVVLTLYRLETKNDVFSFLASPWGILCFAGMLMFIVSASVLVHLCRKNWRPRGRHLILTTVVNLLTVATCLGVGEIVLRIWSVQKPSGTVFQQTLLHPRSWENYAGQYSKAVERNAANHPYYIYDPLLGWTVGPNRRSENGLYFSSVEGLRSPRENITIADRRTTYRIALVGDSFVFGEEVSYEESWGHKLERSLGPEFQVLNFGLSAAGMDQALLRYQRDVVPWQPDMVIFGFISDDVRRNMSIYGFLYWPDGGFWPDGGPIAKPRLTLKDGQLASVNVPVPRGEEIFSKKSIRELPFIEYDMDYHWTEWGFDSWATFYSSYLFRFMVSWYPPLESERQHVSDMEMKALGAEILRSFVHTAVKTGSAPIVVFFPMYYEFTDVKAHNKNSAPLGLSVAQDAQVNYTDLTPCLKSVPSSDRFEKWGHYSPQGNRAVAGCLREVVLSHLRMKH